MNAATNRISLTVILVVLMSVTKPLLAALPHALDGQPPSSLAPMLETVTPAVVNIATEGRVRMQQSPLFADPLFRRFFNIPNQSIERKTQSLGSGVIVDAERGLILTNNHVIANAVEITVTLRNGRHLQAEIVGTDPATDVALLRIPADKLTAIRPADSDALRVGDFVVAIGNPFGLGQTVTSGIVSALGRSGLGIEGYEDFIQTDASINPGNSGGALVNLHGELIGINTAIFSRSGGNIGIGFAIPVNMALQITEQLLEKGAVERGFIGIQIQNVNADLAEAFGLTNQQGAIINRVFPDSPAAVAGLKAGDIITAIDDKKMKNAGDVRNYIGLLPVDKKVRFHIQRNGKAKTRMLQISAKKEAAGNAGAVNPRLEGVTLGDIENEHPLYGKVAGVIVTGLERGSPALRSGLRVGDIITSVNHKPVQGMQDFLKTLAQGNGALLLRVIRGNAAAFLVIK